MEMTSQPENASSDDKTSFALSSNAIQPEDPSDSKQSTRTLNPLPTVTTPAIQAAWDEHVSKLEGSKKQRFESFKQTSYDNYLTALVDSYKEQRSSSTSLLIVGWLKPLFEAVNKYMPIAITMSQASPDPSALILGGICCVMNAAKGFLQFQESITTYLSDMGRKLAIVQEYDDQEYQQPAVKLALVQVVGAVLDFCSEALSFVANKKGKVRGGLKIWSLSIFVSFESAFQGPLTEFENQLETLRDYATVAAHKRIEQSYRSQEETSVQGRQDAQDLLNISSDMLNQQGLANNYKERLEQRQLRRDKEKKKSEVLRWFPGNSYYKYFEDACECHLSGTGQWFLERNEYKNWKEKSSSDLLWCKGKPGSGKSVLAALAISDLKVSLQPNTAVAYVYCKRMDPLARDPLIVISTLLKQICHQSSGLEPGIEAIYERNVHLRISGPGWNEIKQAILSAVQSFDTTYLIVDGLDECDRRKQDGRYLNDLENLLSEMASSSSKLLKVLAFSQPGHANLEAAFDNFASFQTGNGENDEDIRSFVEHEVVQGNIEVGDDSELLETIRTELTTRANGCFLWVSNMISELRSKVRRSQVVEALNSLPEKMERYHELSLLTILAKEKNHRELALDIIFWTVNAPRQLTKDEMIDAVSVRCGSTDTTTDRVSFNGSFTSLCDNLVVLGEDDKFSLRHESVGDYFRRTATEKLPRLKEYWSKQIAAPKKITQACLAYLADKIFDTELPESIKELEDLRDKCPLLEFAVSRCASRLRVDFNRSNDSRALDVILRSQSHRDLILQVAKFFGETRTDHLPFPKRSSRLHVLAYFGLHQAVENLTKLEGCELEMNDDRKTALDYALDTKSQEMTYWILRKNQAMGFAAKSITFTRSPIHVAAENGWINVINILVEEEYDIDMLFEPYSWTPLQLAAKNGHVDCVKRLIKAGANISHRDNNGATTLIHAVGNKNSDLIQTIAEAGADLDALTIHEGSALHAAAREKDLEALIELLDNGASVSGRTWNERTALHIAATTDFTEGARLLIEKGAEINPQGNLGRTPLSVASLHEALSVTRVLLNAKADVQIADLQGMTPLFHACVKKHIEIVKLLVEADCDLVTLNMASKDGTTPLHTAAFRGPLELVELLVEKVSDYEKLDRRNRTPFFFAVMGGNEDIVRLLLRKGVQATCKADDGHSSMHCAATNGHEKLVQLLFNEGVEIDSTSNTSSTPLHSAASRGHVGVLRALLRASTSLNLDKTDNTGKSALHLAALNGQLESVKFLVDTGRAGIFRDNNQNLPIHYAASRGHESVVEWLLGKVDINSRGFKGRTSLILAAWEGRLGVVKLLLGHGADPNITDDDSIAAMTRSCVKRHVQVTSLLLDHGANPKATDGRSRSLLHTACEIGNSPLVEKLLTLKCDILAADDLGHTPLMLAIMSYNSHLIELLVKKDPGSLKSINAYGRNCIHIAAQKGATSDVKRLIQLYPEGLEKKDNMGCSVFYNCIRSGHLSLVLNLFGSKFDPNDLSLHRQTALFAAVQRGSPDMVEKLVRMGKPQNLEIATYGYHYTPILEAAQKVLPQVVEKLLNAGADPRKRDCFGQSTFDYALLHPSILEVFQRTKYQPEATPLPVRNSILRKTIHDTLKTCLNTHSSTTLGSWKRFAGIEILIRSLVMIDEQSSVNPDALPFLFERFHNPSRVWSHYPLWCSFCGTNLVAKQKCVDTTCFSSLLCVGCHEDYLKSGDEDKILRERPPKAYSEMESLESSLQPLRDVVKDFQAEEIPEVVRALEYFTWTWEWVEKKVEAYGEWDRSYNSGKKYTDRMRPGQKFITIMNTARTTIMNLDREENETNKAALAEQAKELFKLQRGHLGDVIFPKYECSGHKYFRLELSERENMQTKGEFLDAAGWVTDNYLKSLLTKYNFESKEQARDSESLLSSTSNTTTHGTKSIEPSTAIVEPTNQSGKGLSGGAIFVAVQSHLRRLIAQPESRFEFDFGTYNAGCEGLKVYRLDVDIKAQHNFLVVEEDDSTGKYTVKRPSNWEASFDQQQTATKSFEVRLYPKQRSDPGAESDSLVIVSVVPAASPSSKKQTGSASGSSSVIDRRNHQKSIQKPHDLEEDITGTPPSGGLSACSLKSNKECHDSKSEDDISISDNDKETKIFLLALKLADAIRPGFEKDFWMEKVREKVKIDGENYLPHNIFWAI